MHGVDTSQREVAFFCTYTFLAGAGPGCLLPCALLVLCMYGLSGTVNGVGNVAGLAALCKRDRAYFACGRFFVYLPAASFDRHKHIFR